MSHWHWKKYSHNFENTIVFYKLLEIVNLLNDVEDIAISNSIFCIYCVFYLLVCGKYDII